MSKASNKKLDTKTLTMLALLAALAYVVMFLSKQIPVNVLGFLNFDLKDVIVCITGFLFGPLAAFVILAREFGVTGLRLVAASDGTVIAAGMSGKVKTFSSLVCLCLMMTPLHSLTLIPPAFTLDTLCVIVMLVTTVWSGAEYFIKFGKLLKVK